MSRQVRRVRGPSAALVPVPVGSVKRWIVVISGFTQTRGADSGSLRLWERMRAFSGPDTVVQLKLWKDDMRDFARMIHHRSAPNERILVCAYSWGAGHGFVSLARELRKLGRSVESAVLCDPVYRSALITFRWRAMTDWGRIVVPGNVGDVRWLRQAENRPRAHDVVAEPNAATWVHHPIVLPLRHGEMDRAAEYHDLAVSEAARVAGMNDAG